MAASVAPGSLQTLVVYNIPGRDCGSYSAGGADSAQAYQAWITQLASGVRGGTRIVLEPDSLGLDCTLATAAPLLQFAVGQLKARGATVYIDASQWVRVDTVTSGGVTKIGMADRLRSAGIAAADGFALNVSNYQTTAAMVAYGHALSGALGGKHFIIDTSRNGNGPLGSQWCNPAGRALGQTPTTTTGITGLDALLWIKRPAESDGQCSASGHHDPGAGQLFPAYALSLARDAGW